MESVVKHTNERRASLLIGLVHVSFFTVEKSSKSVHELGVCVLLVTDPGLPAPETHAAWKRVSGNPHYTAVLECRRWPGTQEWPRSYQ